MSQAAGTKISLRAHEELALSDFAVRDAAIRLASLQWMSCRSGRSTRPPCDPPRHSAQDLEVTSILPSRRTLE
jgi:hypothetical protein